MRKLILLCLLVAVVGCGSKSEQPDAAHPKPATTDKESSGKPTQPGNKAAVQTEAASDADPAPDDKAEDDERETNPELLPELPGDEAVTNKAYEGGAKLKVSVFGVSFTLPSGLRTAIAAGSEAFEVDSTERLALGVILMRRKVTKAEIKQALAEAQQLGGEVVLHPQGETEEKEGTLRQWYGDGQYVALCVAKIGEAGNAIAFLLGAEVAGREWVQSKVGTLIESVRFAAPHESQDEKQWKQLLSGHKLSYLTSSYDNDVRGSTGSRTRIEIALGADGSFNYSYYDSFTVNVPGGTTGGHGEKKDSDRGKWRVELAGAATQLVLTGEKQERRYTLVLSQNKVYLDGKRYLRVPLQ